MNPATDTFPAFWFDGKCAHAQEVELALAPDSLTVHWPDSDNVQRFSPKDTRVSRHFMHAPRLFTLPNGVTLQVEESAALGAALSRSGVAPGRVESWERNWPAALIGLALLIASVTYIYTVALPEAAKWAADKVPPSFEASMGEQILKSLDRNTLLPSQLPEAHRANIQADFDAMVREIAPRAVTRLVFRKGKKGEDINAFALPGGTIVLLDGLVKFANDDDEVAAVLAHEFGHVQYRHMTRGLFQALGGGALAGLIWGDYSSVATNAATVIGVLNYSRDNEDEADNFAVAVLDKMKLPPDALSEFFYKAERKQGGRSLPAWLSTHPDTGVRAERASQAAAKKNADAKSTSEDRR